MKRRITIVLALAIGFVVPSLARRGNPSPYSDLSKIQFYLIDSDDDHPLKPTYNFVDTTVGTWTRVTGFTHPDTGRAQLSQATTMTMPFYDHTLTLPPRYIWVNGLMVFDEIATGSIQDSLFQRFGTLPNSALRNSIFTIVCPLWTDLELRTAGDSSKIYYRVTADTCYVSFYNMALKGSFGRIRATFQVTFARQDSSITFHYRSFDSNIDGESAAAVFQRYATIALQDTLGRNSTNYLDRGFYYAFSRATNPSQYETNLHNGLAVKFRRFTNNYYTLKSISFPPNDGYEISGTSFQPAIRIEQYADSTVRIAIQNEIFNAITGAPIYARYDTVPVGQFETGYTGPPTSSLPCGSFRMISRITAPTLGLDGWTHDNTLTREFVRLTELSFPRLEDFRQFDRCSYNGRGASYATSAESVMRDPAPPYATGALVLDRKDAAGLFYRDPAAGDTLTTSYFNLQGKSNVWIVFSYQRGLRTDSIHAGIRNRLLTGPEVRRTSSDPALTEGDSLIVEALQVSGSTWNPQEIRWSRIGSISGGGIDLETKKFRVQVPSTFLHNHSRFRIRLAATEHGPFLGLPFDDADAYVIDGLQIAAPTTSQGTDVEPIGLELGAKYYNRIPRDVKFISPKVKVASNGLQAPLAVYQVRLILWDALGREVYHQRKSLVSPPPRSEVELVMPEFPIEGSQGGVFTARVSVEQMFFDYWRANDTNTFYRQLSIGDAYGFDDGQPDTAGTMTTAHYSSFTYTFRPLRTDSLRGMEFYHLTANGLSNWVITFKVGNATKYTRSLTYDVLSRGFHRSLFSARVPLSADTTYSIECNLIQGFGIGGDASLGLVAKDQDSHYWLLYPNVLADFSDSQHGAYANTSSPKNAAGGGPLLPMMRLVYRGSSTYLPVELLSLHAKRNTSGDVHIDFSTASEVDAHSFTIDRNVSGVWEHVVDIPARNVSTGASYSAIDAAAPTSEVMYRLTSRDLDGSKQILGIVNIGPMDENRPVRIVPNPASVSARLLLPVLAPNVQATLYDMTGRSVRVFTIDHTNPQIDLLGLPIGMYILEVIAGADRFREKLWIQ